MKWFGHMEISANANERALQCVKYVTSYADRPEREATVLLLLETLRKYELEDNVYVTCLKSNIKDAVSWCALNCKEDILYSIVNEKLDQDTLAIIINNRNVSLGFLEKLNEFTDDSDRGLLNRKILKVRITAARARNGAL